MLSLSCPDNLETFTVSQNSVNIKLRHYASVSSTTCHLREARWDCGSCKSMAEYDRDEDIDTRETDADQSSSAFEHTHIPDTSLDEMNAPIHSCIL